MTYDLSADLDAMLAGLPGASWVTCGDESVRGVFDMADVVEQDGDGSQVQARRATVVLRRGALTDLRVGASVDVDGTTYKVRQIDREDDGLTVRCILAES